MEDIATVRVAVLPTGTLYLPDKWILAESSLTIKTLFPDYSFYVFHPTTGRSLMFDLGLRKALDTYPPVMRKAIEVCQPRVPNSAAELLSQAGIAPKSINFVVYSHLHFDHIGDPYEFPNCEVIVGPGSVEAASPGYPSDKNSQFQGSVLEHPRLRELSFEAENWVSFAPFPRAFDFFGDGSFFLLDAPGHMPGHLIGLARTGADEWVAMGGDCCHHRKIFTGEARVAEGYGPGGASSMHQDIDVARSTIAKVRELARRENVLVCLAHDGYLEPAVQLLPAFLNGWRAGGVKEKIESGIGEVTLDQQTL